MIIASVANIAIPPPRGTALSAKRSALGFETKPAFKVHLLTRAVKTAESKNEPATRPADIAIIVSILAAPVISFLLY